MLTSLQRRVRAAAAVTAPIDVALSCAIIVMMWWMLARTCMFPVPWEPPVDGVGCAVRSGANTASALAVESVDTGPAAPVLVDDGGAGGSSAWGRAPPVTDVGADGDNANDNGNGWDAAPRPEARPAVVLAAGSAAEAAGDEAATAAATAAAPTDSDVIDCSAASADSSSRTGEQVFLYVGILSAPANEDRRDAVRAAYSRSAEVEALGVMVRFFVGLGGGADEEARLRREAREQGDMVLVRVREDYYNIQRKTGYIACHGVTDVRADYIMKADDDSFLDVARLVTLLKSSVTDGELVLVGRIAHHVPPNRDPSSKFHMSEAEFAGAEYPPFAHGPGYLFSRDVGVWIAAQLREGALEFLRLEDVGFGTWVAAFTQATGRRVRFVSDPDRFHITGCAAGVAVAHYQNPERMRCLGAKAWLGEANVCCSSLERQRFVGQAAERPADVYTLHVPPRANAAAAGADDGGAPPIVVHPDRLPVTLNFECPPGGSSRSSSSSDDDDNDDSDAKVTTRLPRCSRWKAGSSIELVAAVREDADVQIDMQALDGFLSRPFHVSYRAMSDTKTAVLVTNRLSREGKWGKETRLSPPRPMTSEDILTISFHCNTDGHLGVTFAYEPEHSSSHALPASLHDRLEQAPAKCSQVQALRVARADGLERLAATFRNFD